MAKDKFPLNKNLIIILILIILSLIFFFRIIFQQYYIYSDVMYQYYPWRNFLVTSLREGVLPQWNPYGLGGMPFIADIQNATFYPLNWLLVFFIENGKLIYGALEIQLILHLILGGLFMSIFTKKLGISFHGSIFAGITFAFSGFLITKVAQVTLFSTFIYLPIILYFAHISIEEQKIKYAIYGGIFFAISIFAGGPQFSVHIFYYTLIYSIFIIFTKFKRKWYKGLIFPAILFLVGIGISAIQILPTSEYTAYSVREFLTYTESTRDSIPFSQFLTLLVPKLFGSMTSMLMPDTVNFWGESGHPESFWETCIYLGILPLFLIFFAYKDKNKRKLVILFSVLTAIFLLAAMGKYTPVYWFIYHVIPGFSRFRIAGRFSGLFTFSALLLSGIGYDAIFKNERFKKVPKALYFFTCICIIFFFLLISGIFKPINEHTLIEANYSNMIAQSIIALIFILLSVLLISTAIKKKTTLKKFVFIPFLLVFIDLFVFGHNYNPGEETPDRFYTEKGRGVNVLRTEYRKEPFRLKIRGGGWLLMPRNAGNVYKLELLEGYNPLGMKNSSDLAELPLKTRLDLFNVKYAIKVDTNEQTKVINVARALNKGYLPRAKMFYSWIVVHSQEQTLELLSSQDFDYRNILLLEKDPNIKMPETPARNVVSIKKHEYNSMEIEVETESSGILFISELYYPCWKAHLDNEPIEILTADHAFRAIAIPAGKHVIKLFYHSKAYNIGKIITLITLILSIAFLIIKRHPKN